MWHATHVAQDEIKATQINKKSSLLPCLRHTCEVEVMGEYAGSDNAMVEEIKLQNSLVFFKVSLV